MARFSPPALFFMALLVLLLPINTEAQQKANPLLQNFTPAQYGAHDQAWDITQSREGHIVIGTGSGIVIYDGEEFQMVSGTPLMVNNLITAADGTIFYSASNKLGRLTEGPDGYPHYYSLDEKMDSEDQNFGPQWNLLEYESKLYVPARNKFFAYANDKFKVIESDQEFYKTFSLNGELFISELNEGLLQLNSSNKLVQASGGGALTNELLPVFMLPFDEHRVIVGTVSNGLYLFYTNQLNDDSAGSLEPFSNEVNDLLISENINEGIQLKNGNYAIGTSTSGVVIINRNGELVQKIDKYSGLQSEVVNRLYEDRQGNLWMALNYGFAMAEISNPISFYDENSGLEGTVIDAVELNNTIYAATSMGLFKKDGFKFNLNSDVTAITWDLGIYQEQNGNSLLAANNTGLFMVDESSTTQLSSNYSMSVMQSKLYPERIYAGTPSGLFYVEKKGDQFIGHEEILDFGNPVRQLLEDDNGGIWVATQSDGLRYVHSDFNPDTITEYRSTDNYFVSHNATMHWIDEELFVSTITNFYKYDSETDDFIEWRNTELGDNELDGIYRFYHKNGTLWSGASSEREFLTEYRTIFSETPQRIETPFRSVPSTVTLFINEILGDIWFGNSQGLYQFRPVDSSQTAEFKQPQIRRIDVITDTTITVNPAFDPPLELAFGNTRLRYTVAAPWFDTNYSMEYRYKLENYDQQWSDWTDNPIVEYTSIREGNYNFMVQARNREGKISDAALYSFNITPPWYRSMWAYTLYLFLLIGMVYGSGKSINIYQTRRLEEFNRKLERQVKQRSAEIRRQNQELKRMNQEKNEFMNIAVHDLRNPLSGIQGLANLLTKIDENPSTDEVRTLGTVIHDSSLQMFELIDKYLNVHRIEQGEIIANLKPISLNKVTHTSLQRFEDQIVKKDLTIDIQSAKEAVIVSADSELIIQVLDNLISNAIKYSYEGSKITLILKNNNGSGTVTVQDQGAGISKENQKKLYSKFSQIGTKPTGGEVSIGLGLSIVKKLMTMMNGEIHCESELGHGTSFTISLPLSKKVREPQM